jgi:hypothetical protein
MALASLPVNSVEDNLLTPISVTMMASVVSNNRSPERYMFNFYSLFSIVISNLAIFGCLLSYYSGGRKMQKIIQSGN